MTATEIRPGQYGFDDVNVGDWMQTGSALVSAEAIDAFAALSGDRFEIHMDRGAAQSHGFPDRVAHGLLILSLVDGLKNQTPAQFKAQASLGWDWSFRAPVLAGDSVLARIEVVEKTVIKDPDRGILKLRFEVSNQGGELVQEGWNRLMVYR